MKHRRSLQLRVQDAFTKFMNRHLRKHDWKPQIVPFTGYGTADHVRVLARVVLRPSKPKSHLGMYAEQFLNQRGWRNFFRIPVPGFPVTIEAGEHTIHARTDHAGYIDLHVKRPGLEPGWHNIALESAECKTMMAPVQVVSADETFGIISDIDDTIISTWLPRLFLAAWNSFVMTEGNRQAVAGMARMYQKLLDDHPGAPLVYVSTGSWDTLPFLNRFMKRHGFPKGPILLTNFGPSQTAWFRNGRDHKRYSLFELARDFPNISWLCVGDDGQHDPMLYRQFSELMPDRVRTIAIRELSQTEQILAHGSTTMLADNKDALWKPTMVPELSGEDGDELLLQLQEQKDKEKN